MTDDLGIGAEDGAVERMSLELLVAERQPDDQDQEAALAAIEGADGQWRRPVHALDLGDVRWRPDLARKNGVLHLSLTGELPRAWLRRMRAARGVGRQITVAFAAPPEDVDVLVELQELDARIVTVMRNGALQVRSYRSIADWLAAARIHLAPEDLRRLAQPRLEEALAEPTMIKGRFFEEVLCLVFSQVSWLTVDEHAYNNASEEIDLVLGVRTVGYLAAMARGPVAIATVKNEAKATGSATVKYLKEQMANRKGRCRLGFLCSATTISEEARIEILRGSQGSDLLIALLDQVDLRRLLANAEQLDDEVEKLLRRAVAG